MVVFGGSLGGGKGLGEVGRGFYKRITYYCRSGF